MPRRTFADLLEENTRLWNENELLRSRIEWQGDDSDPEDDSDTDDDDSDSDDSDDEG